MSDQTVSRSVAVGACPAVISGSCGVPPPSGHGSSEPICSTGLPSRHRGLHTSNTAAELATQADTETDAMRSVPGRIFTSYGEVRSLTQPPAGLGVLAENI